MKLYNLFEDAIFEEVERIKILLKENVSTQEVVDAINGKYNVNILYDDYPDATPAVPPSKRYIQVYNFAETKAGNDAIRAFQIGGPSKTTTGGAWKIFRLDRIRGWVPTKVRWKRPVSDLSSTIPTYNKDGDRTMSRVFNKVEFGPMEPHKPTGRSRELTSNEKNKMPIKKPALPKKQQSSYISNDNPKPVDTSNTTNSNKINKKLK